MAVLRMLHPVMMHPRVIHAVADDDRKKPVVVAGEIRHVADRNQRAESERESGGTGDAGAKISQAKNTEHAVI